MGGVVFGLYCKSLEKLLVCLLVYFDIYLVLEGFFVYNVCFGIMNMWFVVGYGIFYEFIFFDECGFDEIGNLFDSFEVFILEEVEEGVDYVFLVFIFVGVYCYMIGDIIKFIDLDQLEIKIFGCIKYFFNVVGLQLFEEKMNVAIQELSEDFGMLVNEFVVVVMKNEDGNFIYQWVIVILGDVDEAKVVECFDEVLKIRNKNYVVVCSKGFKLVEFIVLVEFIIYDWLE